MFYYASEENYLGLLSFDIGDILSQIEYYFYLFPEFFLHKKLWFFQASAFVSCAFVLLGVIQNYKKYYFYILFCGFSLSILLLFQARQGIRYLFPVAPFYFFFMLHGIAYLCQKFLQAKLARKVSVFASLVLSLVIFIQTAYFVYKDAFIRDSGIVLSPKAKELYAYVKQHTQISDTILFFKSRPLRLFTGRKATFSRDSEKALKKPYDYLIIFDSKGNDYYTKTWRPYLPALKDKLLFDNQAFQLYGLSVRSRR